MKRIRVKTAEFYPSRRASKPGFLLDSTEKDPLLHHLRMVIQYALNERDFWSTAGHGRVVRMKTV
jgi:hypothetical protein